MTEETTAGGAPPRPGWRAVLKGLTNPRVAIMLALGFSSGLPFLLTGNTLGAWLREEGTTLTAIGFIGWVGFAYSFKFLWAPILDRARLPGIGRLGKRRSWILIAQIFVAAGLIGMVFAGPQAGLVTFGALALVVAFASATQDIAVDAWRIEAAHSDEELALLSAGYQLGYRASLLITNALIFIVAANVGWELSYTAMAALMLVGMAAALMASEPDPQTSAVAQAAGVPMVEAPLWTPRGLYEAIIGPFAAFLQTHGGKAVLLLAAVSLYRMPDFVMGPMINPFYLDLGITREEIGGVRATVGLIATSIGVAAGGLAAFRLGFTRTLIIGAFLAPASNLGYTVMAATGGGLTNFAVALFVENLSEGFAGTALIAWMSSLTSFGYAATQYALLSSFYTLLGKFLKGFSGVAVETMGQAIGLIPAYGAFFALTAAIGIPSVLVSIWAARAHGDAREAKGLSR
ncbi:AmpG family muropeptide MFS transporter [Maricaulaceae bacterium MS644]